MQGASHGAIVGQMGDLDKTLAGTPEYPGLSRASHNRHAESRDRRERPREGSADGSNRPASDGDGRSTAAATPGASPAAGPASIDAALDAFVTRAQAEFASAPTPNAATGRAAYHPAPANLPWRWLAVGIAVGVVVGALASLALRR
jgi:hypothetical protein